MPKDNLTDSILKLKIAFADLPMNGLFFWESLLSLDDNQYRKVVEENFTNVVNSDIPDEDKDLKKYYQEILEALNQTRSDVIKDSKIKAEVEKIREALISEAAQEKLVETMRENLAKKK